MTMRPEDIKNRTFALQMRGYDKDEVRSFLSKVAESSRQLSERLTATEAELAAAAASPEPTADIADDPAPEYGNEWAPSGFDGENTVTAESADGTPSIDADVVDPMPDAPAFADVPVADVEPQPVAAVDTTDLAAAEVSIADRYEALGDRIADLLRNADSSAADIIATAEADADAIRAAAETDAERVRLEAEERASQMLAEAQAVRTEADTYRDEIMAEVAATRTEQEAALQEARRAAETEVETFRVDSIEEIKALRSEAQTEVEEMRSSAHAEVAELRQTAQVEADQLREQTLTDAHASIADDQAEATRLREEADADRATARAELDDVRNEVSTLLEQARTQSEFIKQEADEIIRTKVRSSFEQAQTRLDVLRNTEIASRERILLAQSELNSALNRLDADPLPELDPENSAPVIEEATLRSGELAPAVDATSEPAPVAADVVEAEADLIEADVIEADLIEADVVGADLIEADVPEGDLAEGDLPEADLAEGDLAEADVVDTSFEQSVFEADVAEATQEIEESSLSDFFGPGPAATPVEAPVDAAMDADSIAEVSTEDRVSDVANAFDAESGVDADVLAGDQFVDDADDADLDGVDAPIQGWDTTEVESVESGFDVTEHVVVEAADELPVRGELPQRGASEPAEAESFGAASLSEALPSEMVSTEVGSPAQEDALARLVREAMQEAVDSARKND